MLKEFEAKTLEEAYEQASLSLNCSINDLDVEVVQQPSKGFFGFFSKNAIIKVKVQKKKYSKTARNSNVQDIKVEPLTTKLNEMQTTENIKEIVEEDSSVAVKQIEKQKIFNEFYDSKNDNVSHTLVVKKDNKDLINEIENEITDLFSNLCYEIDDIKVSIIDDKTVYMQFSGPDCALLIGKDGYRYNALSYILFNWVNIKYNMMLKLEIAEFFKNQEEYINDYLNSAIAVVNQDGYFKTKFLDGILIHIALTKLRDTFPDKYVAVKTTQKGDKYILVNEYRK